MAMYLIQLFLLLYSKILNFMLDQNEKQGGANDKFYSSLFKVITSLSARELPATGRAYKCGKFVLAMSIYTSIVCRTNV